MGDVLYFCHRTFLATVMASGDPPFQVLPQMASQEQLRSAILEELFRSGWSSEGVVGMAFCPAILSFHGRILHNIDSDQRT